jgi:hypothetical protein
MSGSSGAARGNRHEERVKPPTCSGTTCFHPFEFGAFECRLEQGTPLV